MKAALFVATALALAGANAVGETVIAVKNGVNHVDLGGHAGLALRAHRDNFNAHGFDLVTLYAFEKTAGGEQLDLVPLFGDGRGGGKEQDSLAVGGGADCLLHDFRLLRGANGQPARLVLAERDFGDSYVAPGIVHFTYYTLTANADGMVGWPPLYFQAGQRVDSRVKYCDVDQAFDQELHLGPSSDGAR